MEVRSIELNVDYVVGQASKLELELFLSEHNSRIVLLCETKLNNRYKLTSVNFKIILIKPNLWSERLIPQQTLSREQLENRGHWFWGSLNATIIHQK